MLVVHVIRKPLSEGNVASNVLRWGTGALNIQASRVAGGRWPANMILEHKAGCQCVGSKVVRSSGGTTDAGGGPVLGVMNDDGWEPKPRTIERPWQLEAGTETVPQWECREGCPVAALDEQTGILTTNPGTYRKTGRDGDGSTYALDTQEGRVLSRGDKGGASRYFKQVKP